uniref:EF-hand domain-containing protein n=1 Tax=Monodon monoceros TaxID=40151 RepID=A0A8C6AV71_MONMO
MTKHLEAAHSASLPAPGVRATGLRTPACLPRSPRRPVTPASLEVNREGRLCVNDLAMGLRLLGLHRTGGEIRKIVQAGDKDLDGQLDFEEFAHYFRDHEKKLRLVFKSLDKKNDGRIDAGQITLAGKRHQRPQNCPRVGHQVHGL